MNNIEKILNNPKYKELLKKLEELEENRVFCKHNLEHFLDVARISYIYVLENKLTYSKDIIYVIALLHDIGRVLEYEENIDHHNGSVILANELLKETNFKEEETELIIKAIENHRSESSDELSKIIYKADKLSRNCFNCKAKKECYWDENKKNKTIII